MRDRIHAPKIRALVGDWNLGNSPRFDAGERGRFIVMHGNAELSDKESDEENITRFERPERRD